MNYEKTVAWMFHQLPMYQTQGAIAYKANLDNIQLLDKHLSHPHHSYKSIHVAGTNGKGSTSAMLASILKTAGYKVGLYTSPHLTDYRERITINGVKISKRYVTQFINANKTFFEAHDLSFFEMSVGLALSYFKDKKVDIAIIEVGMGGRLDATNIITPILSVITSIGLDHTQFLGETLEAIASEKAGIIKTKIPVVIGDYQTSLKPIFDNIAASKQTQCRYTLEESYPEYESDLKGHYQIQNKKTVLEAIKIIKEIGLTVTTTHIKKGLLNVVKNTGLQGRWQVLNTNPMIVCDTAHNKD
jgi:dihydrofolate synthase/folylpolyglutamate synthase